MIFQTVAHRPISYFFKCFGLLWLGFMCFALMTGLTHITPFIAAAWIGAGISAAIYAVLYSVAIIVVCIVITLAIWLLHKSGVSE